MKIPKRCKIEKIVGKKERRKSLNYAWLEAESNRIVATNNHAIAFVPVEVGEGEISGPVPPGALAEARKTPFKGLVFLSSTSESHITLPSGENIERPKNMREKPDFDWLERNYAFEESPVIKLDAKLLYTLAQAIGSDKITLTLGIKNPESSAIKVEPAGGLHNKAYGYLMPVK